MSFERANMQSREITTESNEIGMRDIQAFLKRNKLRIVIGGFAGVLLATAYIIIAHKKFEATLQVQMAYFTGGNSEEPAALLQRSRLPTAYSMDVQQSCGVAVEGDMKDYLNGLLKMEIVKSVPNLIEIKVRAFSQEQAKQCAEVIFAMIVEQQRKLIDAKLAGRQEQLKQYLQSLHVEQEQLKSIRNADIGNFGYLAKLDKLSWLRTRIDSLQEEALMSQMHPAKLVVPIYAPNKPVAPKVGLFLTLGALLGLMLGVLYAVGRDGWRKAT